ncbi:ParA family protein [Halegenticoccus tardaugens]|uniref:ParA family protein n=1 Tax=Halegenticoccus tardaugens TaxID=2071624 RepID=UPI00100B562C|nr:ParA family protein [Halegenticoccus tardaugens]
MRLCVSNQKGGTGKTTVAVNVAGALANRGNDVLLIDLDPQGYATEGTGLGDAYDEDSLTLHDVLLELDNIGRLGELIREGVEFDVIPSNATLTAKNTQTQLQQAKGGERRIGMALDRLDREYDFIVIDCPPGLGALTDNALLATGHVLIPAETKGTSMRALELLRDQIDSLALVFPDSEIEPVGVVANEVRTDGVSEQMLEWFSEVFGDAVPIYEVRKRVALQRALMAGRSIQTHDEECDMEAVFDEIAADLEVKVHE